MWHVACAFRNVQQVFKSTGKYATEKRQIAAFYLKYKKLDLTQQFALNFTQKNKSVFI